MILSHSYKASFCLCLFLGSIISLIGCGGNGSNPSGLPYWLENGSKIAVVAERSTNAFWKPTFADVNWAPLPATTNIPTTISLTVIGAYRVHVTGKWISTNNALFNYTPQGNTFKLKIDADNVLSIEMVDGRMHNVTEPGKGKGTVGTLKYNGMMKIDNPNPGGEHQITAHVKYEAHDCDLTHDLN